MNEESRMNERMTKFWKEKYSCKVNRYNPHPGCNCSGCIESAFEFSKRQRHPFDCECGACRYKKYGIIT